MGGGDPSILILFYKSFIRSIMDYGSIRFANAPKSTLILQDRVQNYFIRLAIGATKYRPSQLSNSNPTLPPLLKKNATNPSIRPTLSLQYRHINPRSLSHYTRHIEVPPSYTIHLPNSKSLKGTFHLTQTDEYPYKALPYMEIFNDWPSKFLKLSNNLPATQEFLNLINGNPQYHPDHSIRTPMLPKQTLNTQKHSTFPKETHYAVNSSYTPPHPYTMPNYSLFTSLCATSNSSTTSHTHKQLSFLIHNLP